MSISADDPDDNPFRTVTLHGVELRVSADGKTVECRSPLGWHALEQIPDRWNKGYLRVRLPGGRTVAVHKLVALAFYGEPPSPRHVMVEHLDGSRQRNHRDNVRWATHTDNLNSALRLHERERKYPVKLNPALVWHLRTQRSRDELREIADEVGTGEQTVRDVFDGHTWRHVRLDQPPLPGTF